jgi:hypothetical protein
VIVDARRLRLSLLAVQLVGIATLLRSIAYDRWITVLASVLLIVGASAAQRGRSWGVALSFGAAAAFPVAWAIGIAPPWFCLVGIIGALPFALASRAFARFDRGATALLAVLAASAGAFGALAWKEYAWSLFMSFPSIRPSLEAQHGLALTAVVASAIVAARLGRGTAGAPLAEESHVRIAQHVRVADLGERSADVATDAEEHEAHAPERRRAHR